MIQKAKENTRRGIFRIAGCCCCCYWWWWWWWQHFIDESHDSRNGRLKKERKTKQDEKKKNPLCRSGTLIRFSCKVPFVRVYAHFLVPPSPASSVFFISSLVYTDQNPVTAYEPIGRQLGGCHGDKVGGACASCTTNLLRFEMGVASTSPPNL